MIITKKYLPRRTFLRGLGATLALPLLDGMVPALTALSKTAAKPVRRFGVFYLPNGIMMQNWTPTAEGSAFEFTQILEPLTPFRNRLTVLSGLINKEADPLPGEGAGDHSRGPAVFLTCAHARKTEGADVQAAVSLDQIVAKELGMDTQLPSLEIGLESGELLGACDPGYSCAYVGTVAWRSPTTPLPIENDPRAVFERLFGATDSTEPRARAAQRMKDRSILDTLTQDVARLQKGLGAGDRAKLAEYLGAVRDVERRIQTAEEQSARDLPVVERPASIPDAFEEHAGLMFDLLTLAYQTDLTRVFTFMVAREITNKTYPESGVPDPHHSASHHLSDPEKMAKYAKLNAYHVKTFATFVEKLRSTPDGEGSLLDHSMIMYGAGISDGDRHTHDNLPILLIGGGAGQLKGGRHLRYPKDTPLANLHVTVLDKMGIPVERFGDSTGRLSDV
jgi:hypothetical protein